MWSASQKEGRVKNSVKLEITPIEWWMGEVLDMGCLFVVGIFFCLLLEMVSYQQLCSMNFSWTRQDFCIWEKSTPLAHVSQHTHHMLGAAQLIWIPKESFSYYKSKQSLSSLLDFIFFAVCLCLLLSAAYFAFLFLFRSTDIPMEWNTLFAMLFSCMCVIHHLSFQFPFSSIPTLYTVLELPHPPLARWRSLHQIFRSRPAKAGAIRSFMLPWIFVESALNREGRTLF